MRSLIDREGERDVAATPNDGSPSRSLPSHPPVMGAVKAMETALLGCQRASTKPSPASGPATRAPVSTCGLGASGSYAFCLHACFAGPDASYYYPLACGWLVMCDSPTHGRRAGRSAASMIIT